MTVSVKQSTIRLGGFTVVELMIAMTIGLTIIAGAVGMYNRMSMTNQHNEILVRMSEVARYSFEELEYHLRMSGYWGRTEFARLVEGRMDDPSVDVSAAPYNDPATCYDGFAVNASSPVEVLNNITVSVGSDWYRCLNFTANQALDGTDVLVARHVNVNPIAVGDLQADSLYLVSNYVSGQLFYGTTVPAGYIATDPIYPVENHQFFVLDNSSLSTGSDEVPGLAKWTHEVATGVATDAPRELAPSVEDLQVQFGVDTNDDDRVDGYINPDDPALAGADIMTVKLWLRIRSVKPSPLTIGGPSLNYADITYTPAADDVYLHRVFSRTVAVRNEGEGIEL
ncbi:MAG: hypothetical protein HKM24_03750 [Gammaproteobacteria bacterium]|nr:hypothetical protein [Gammaproteobacteria bacterium]